MNNLCIHSMCARNVAWKKGEDPISPMIKLNVSSEIKLKTGKLQNENTIIQSTTTNNNNARD